MPEVQGKIKNLANRVWTDADREELFKRVFNAFGNSSKWLTVVPEKGHEDALASIGKDLKRTPGAIKAQIRDVVSKKVSARNIKSIRRARKIAHKIGLINEDQLKVPTYQ